MVKKKDNSQSTSPEVVTESTTQTVQESPGSLDASATVSSEVAASPEEIFQFEAGRRNRGQEELEEEVNVQDLSVEEIEENYLALLKKTLQ